MEGFGHVLDTPRMRLALVRDDLESAGRLLAEPMPVRGWHRGRLLISTRATHLDALAALGRRQQGGPSSASTRSASTGTRPRRPCSSGTPAPGARIDGCRSPPLRSISPT